MGADDGGRNSVSDQAERAGFDEQQEADEQHAGAQAVRYTGAE